MKLLSKIICSFALLFGVGSLFNTQVHAESMKIVIDPGHGGSDPGAVNNGLREKDLTLQLSKRIEKYLSPYADVTLTRETDKYLSLEQRANFANSLDADLFFSIHFDSSVNPYANGISTHYSSYRANLDQSGYYVVHNGGIYDYVDERKINGSTYIYYTDRGVTKRASINDCMVYDSTPGQAATDSKELSLELANSLASLGFNKMYTSTGTKDHNLYVTRHTNMASVLIENGFTSNVTEANKVSSPSFQDKMAKKIADTVINHYGLGKPVITTYTVDKASPQVEGTRVILYARASNGDNLQYKFWQHNLDTDEWKLLQDYSADTNIGWTPDKSGNYELVVHVREGSSTNSYDTYKVMQYQVKPKPVSIQSYTSDLPSPQAKETRVIINANAINGEELQYKFWQHNMDTDEWKLLQDYSTDTNIGWTPDRAGKYQLVVHVKEAASSRSYDTYKVMDYLVKNSLVEIQQFTSDKPSPQLEGTQVIVNAKAVNGEGLLYKFWEQNLTTGEWKLLQDYSVDTNITWTSSKADKYKIVVHVKESDSVNSYDTYKAINYVLEPNPLTISSVNVDKPSPQPYATDIQISATSNISETANYKFWLFNKKTNQWSLLQDYGPDSNVIWSPVEPGEYKLVVHAKNEGSLKSYDDYQYINYTVKKIIVDQFNADKVSPQPIGTSVIVNASARGSESIEYKFWEYNYGTKKWRLLQNYNADTNVEWLPSASGKYKLVVHIKESTSQASYDTYEYMNFNIN
ncbi:N-acetylmuramoyl-L-alanine amidase [Radiobacillus kanasensis]|uniref:N-acetylmuramoyl-L-alanine amidase n=1 Tax=Radiobacillus kanasensis TaxID=2844358 RepID=UPI001E2B8506|nr:N-acetylmuramoyl-L-alanine amidase [Radiobacillus kanasensis]UFT98877.1 N-acetylmuramoyl-L-alanine amidase [Radiobacillus kanasensis]